MNESSASPAVALEHLRVIRTLMERAHVYRAVSAPAALFGGLMAVGLGVYGVLDSGVTTGVFLTMWLVLLVVCTALNLGLLMREARSQGRAFVTDELRTALKAVLPPLLVGGVLGGGLLLFRDEVVLGVVMWILCYGLALLATAGFAPRSILRLGHLFLWSGLGLAVFCLSQAGEMVPVATASIFMGMTFGLFHLVYAVAVFMNREVKEG